MEFSDNVKIEADHKVCIDLDDGGECPEDAVVEWHLAMKRFFDENAEVVGENNLVNIMKVYTKSITTRAIHFEHIETLKVVAEKHIEHIYWLYKDLDLRFSDTYLENMEHIMTFYLNLILRLLLELKKKVKVTQSMVSDMSKSVIKRLSSYLLESEYHIFHVLIRQTINYSDNLVKDVLNILQSNICKQLFKNLYMHYLFSSPLTDKSDEAFCRVYIIFENWKAFEGNRQDEQINNLMTDLLGRGSECIKDNKFLTLILKPQVSVISELMRTVGCDPAITKAYFDCIKSRLKQDLEILDDIEKLALEDRGCVEDDDEDDDDYNELFETLLGDALKDFIDDTHNNTDVKDGQEFKSPAVEQDDEVIYCDSDSDSDIEIVSIKPSTSCGKAVNVSQRLYIQSLKNTGTIKPPKTSFLDSIFIDSDAKDSIIDSKSENCTSDKNLRPNPLSQVFRKAEVKSADDPKPYEVDNESHRKHDTINSGMSNQECHSRTSEQLENSNINLSSSSETESSQDLENTSNITLISTNEQLSSSSLQDNNPIDESSRVIIENDVLTQIRTNMNDLNINISNPIENSHCNQSASPQICENEISDTLHCSQVTCSEGFQDFSSGDSCSEPLTVSPDGKAQIEESGSSISNILQKEVNQKECSTILNETNTLIENNKPAEETQITTTDIHVCHCSKLREQNSLVSNREIEGVSQNLQAESYVDPKLQFEEENLKNPCHSLNKDSSKSACDVNSNVSTLSLEPIISSHKEDETLIENSTLPVCQSTIDETDQTSCGTKIIEVSNESNEPPTELHVLCNSNESKDVTQNSPMVSKINDVASEKFVEKEVAITNYIHAEDVNHRSDNQMENQLYKQIILHSDEQLDLQSFPSEMQIDYPATVSSVCKINEVIDQNGKSAQTIDSVESSKSETIIANSTILPEKSVRCSHMIKEVFKKDLTLRKGGFKLLKRRHSDSNVYECSGSNRWGADLMCEKFDFKAVRADSQASVHPSPVCGQSSMFLDTGQVVAPPPIDTGQSQIIAELSPPMPDQGEEPVADSVNRINQKTAQHMCSVKRTKTQSDKDELCGYPTPPGSEEDIDDTQPDPVYSKIFPTPACSSTDDCYRSDRAVFRLDSETEHDVTVDDSATTVKDVSQIRSTDNRKDLPAETVVPDIVYNDQTMSENDFLTEEIDPRDSMVSLEEEELLERLSDEERNEENETASRNLAKSFAQIARDAVCDHDSEDSPKHTRSVHESGLNRNATPSPSKAEMSENMENLADIVQFPENCEKRFDFYDSPIPSSKKRKRQLKDVQKAREKSQIKRRKMARKVETRIKSFDEFEADVWNRQSPIVKFAYDCDAYESDTDETTSQHSNIPNPRMESVETPTSVEKPPLPIEKHVRVNGSSMNSPPLSCSNPVPKHPPLKGILKKVEQSHSYHPLHPVDDDPTSSYVYIHVESDPDIGRGKMRSEGSWIKVSRNSLNAYKVSRNYKKLFERYPRICVNCVNIERKNISDSSKRLLRKTNLELSCRIDYNKGTNDHKISFLEQPAIDESSTTVNTRNPSFEIGLRPGTVNLSNEIVSIESTDDDLSHAVQLHIPPISPCLSPTSNASSEFSDPTNLIPYQDIERALQVVEPDDQTCSNSPAEQSDSLQRHSGADMLDNMSVEAIKLLSNNADFHKIFSDFDGEILIENVPVLETEETENILNIDGTFIKLPPKVDVRLSDKLSDDLILNLKSDEELLKKICQELETNSLVYSLSNSTDNAAVMNSPEILEFSEDTYRDSNRLISSANGIPIPEPDAQSVDEKEGKVNAFSQNSIISTAKSDFSSPTLFLPNSSEGRLKTLENCSSVDFQSDKHTNILQNNCNPDAINVSDESFANIQVNQPSNSQISTQVSHCSLANNHYFPSVQVNSQSFQNSQIYQTPQVSSQIFQSSRIGQPLICSTLDDPSLHQPLVGNLTVPTDSLIELSHNSVEQNNCLTTQNSMDISASNLSVTAMSNEMFYSSLNPLQVITGALQPLQTDVVSSQSVQKLSDDVSSSINNALLYSSDKKKKASKRGRPPKKPKKTKEKSHATSNHVKRPDITDCHQERVPPIYDQELLPTQTYIATDQGKSLQRPAERVNVKKKVNKESVITDPNRTSSVANVQGKQKLLPMPVPQTFNFETDTLKQEVYKIRLESGKVENNENDAEFETHLPLKKRKLSIPVPITSSSLPASKPTSTPSSLENVESNEISYPATPMLSIADLFRSSRPFKTPAEKKQLPVDPSPLPPIRYDLPNDATPFTCNMNTFNSNVYYLNECPYNVKLDGSSYCPPPPVLFPPESFGRSN